MSSEPTPVHAAERLATRRLAQALGLPAFAPGTVWLAGAGPGDPGLITLLGLHALGEADLVLYDALVNPALLDLASPTAKRLYVGKRGGRPSCKQGEISHLLVSAARKGRRVLRLKGGDPFVFGRGGEEALALARAGIAFRVVPGVTAGIGGLAYAGIPVTHRDTNHAVTFVTGHGADGRLPELDWTALSKGAPTLVFYMALAQADEIAARLMAAGRSGDEPAAIVSDASAESQTVRVITLGQLGDEAKHAAAPALIVVGENVRLRDGLDWLGALKDARSLDPDPLKRDAVRAAS